MPSEMPPFISSYGGEIDAVFNFIWWTVNGWFLLAEVALVYCVIRFRKKKGERAAWMPADTWKVQAWVLVPVMLVLLCDLVIEYRSHGVWNAIKGESPPHDVLVRVTGRQFSWSFTYAGNDGKLDTADDFTSDSEFHVPLGKVVKIQLESNDVLHSFWVPALRFKQDVVPGRSISGWFQADKDGQYDIACAELCGASHTSMRAVLTVEAPEAYALWSDTHTQQQASLDVKP